MRPPPPSSFVFCLAAVVGAWLAGTGCSGVRSPEEMASVVRAEGGACSRGDVTACRKTCASEGPNASCDTACKSGDGEACYRLAGRLDRGVDALEPGAPLKPIGEPEPLIVTSLYEKACEAGLGPGCRLAGERMLTGQGAKKDAGASAVALLKKGCEQLQDGLSCCGMAQLNQALGASGPGLSSPGGDFKSEARRWRVLATTRGVTCPSPDDQPAP